jgi:hypothetical protein
MNYLAHYAEDGRIKGFYVAGMHRDIPIPTMGITADQHADYFSRGQNHRVVNGSWTYVDHPIEPEPQIITPEIDQDTADMWEAILTLSAELETLKGGQ